MQASTEEWTGKAGLWDRVLLNCSASPSPTTDRQKSLPPQKAAGRGSAKPKCHFGFTLGSLQGLEELPRYIPRTVRAGAIKHSKVAREKSSLCPGLHFLLSPGSAQCLSHVQQVLKLEESLTHSLSRSSVIHTCGFGLWKKKPV